MPFLTAGTALACQLCSFQAGVQGQGALYFPATCPPSLPFCLQLQMNDSP